ncbi:hypothetical protein GRX01_02240 [Halobaculum sp. WSA2]|uniref:Uncharacterized protein n=1 Tax=Halobaculum saliterrae TaxID=2073113 RepID=A0A6B0SMR8_9EURY|nr:hypothetical protein [Halobaculum saliterrae]MXR40178.1 hypothetical protein [Halobaculum saliterrae]
MADPDLVAHLVDLKYLLVALVVATVAAEAAATGYDGNWAAVPIAAAIAVLPVALVYFVFESPSRVDDAGS